MKKLVLIGLLLLFGVYVFFNWWKALRSRPPAGASYKGCASGNPAT
ncbi:MAG: hypothetical protein KAW12_17225 [Candidatus Aminicenantes bacterium]|nr:hypothetical protein [Candidatus Aminicenantes bacterium]